MTEELNNLTDEQKNKIGQFYDLHMEATINVTAIKDKESFYIKHVLDSYLIFTKYKQLLKGDVADIGTGGGFPGVILATLYPEIKFTLVDSIAKKCRFVDDCVKVLGLTNAEVINARAEDIKDRRFGTILSRGVAKTEQLLKFTWHMADKDTVWVLYKGENIDAELKEAGNIIKNKKLEYRNVRYDEPIQRTYTVLYFNGCGDRLGTD